MTHLTPAHHDPVRKLQNKINNQSSGVATGSPP